MHCTFLLLPLLFRHILMVFNNACHNKLVGDGCTFGMQTFSEFCSNIIRITFAEPMRVYLVSYVCGNRKAMVSKSDSESISIHVFDRVTTAAAVVAASSSLASGNIITQTMMPNTFSNRAFIGPLVKLRNWWKKLMSLIEFLETWIKYGSDRFWNI